MKGNRIAILDTLRGITIISMIAYHFVWDLRYLYGFDMPWFSSPYVYYWQQSICWTFILLSGFCWSLGKHPLRRGIEIFSFGAIITVITLLFLPEDQIIFGILTFLGSAMILMVFFQKYLERIPVYAGLVISFFAFLCLKGVSAHRLGILSWSLTIPDFFYRNLVTTYFGFPCDDFYSVDYFALLPWLFLFLTGFFLYRIYRESNSNLLQFAWNERAFSWIGRKSIIVYLLHQPLLYVIYLIWLQLKG